VVWSTLGVGIAMVAVVVGWNMLVPGLAIKPWMLLTTGFVGGLVLGVPIAFVLGLSSLVFFMADPSLPMLVYSQQVMAGTDHYVLLAIPFFVLAGLLMEANGMSSRLIELLLRMFGRVRGGLGLITITATAFFSGVSGSKLADIAAVGGIIMPAVRKTKQDPNETAGLLACTAVMAETIPPCINMIIMGFVANISIAGLFMAGLVPAAVLALSLAAVTIYVGTRINPDEAFDVRTPMFRLLGGAMVALVMVAMIGKGVTSGVATSTEVSAFAVVYALVVGWMAFRELTVKSVAQLFVRSASMAGGILFIVAAASSVSFALTIQQIPQYLSTFMIGFAHSYGSTMFVLLSVLIMIVFGAVLEGRARPDHLRPAADADCLAAGRQSLTFWDGHGDCHGPGAVRAADRIGAVRHLRHHRHRAQGRLAAHDEIPGGAVRHADPAGAGAAVFTVAADPHGPVKMRINLLRTPIPALRSSPYACTAPVLLPASGLLATISSHFHAPKMPADALKKTGQKT
jgi:tripartite ATP-independent transporter DctM subunit